MLRWGLVTVAVLLLVGGAAHSPKLIGERSRVAVSRNEELQELVVVYVDAKTVTVTDYPETSNTPETPEATTATTTTTPPPTTTPCSDSLEISSLDPDKTSINATWKFVNGCSTLTKFQVTWTGGGSYTASANARQYLILNLNPCSNYNVTVTAKGSAEWPVTDTTATLDDAPPSVTGLNNTAPEARSVTLTWQRPVTECDITEYFISYDGAAKWGDNDTLSGSNNTSGDTLEFVVTGLVPYSSYKMCVMGRNGKGDGTEDCLEAVDTEQAVPSAPTGLTVVPASSSSLTASWSEPDAINGVLGEYTVTWAAGGPTSSNTTTATTLLIDGLDACVTYSVTVTASTRAGEGAASRAVDGTTKEEAPPAVTELEVTTLEARDVTLTWTRPDTACELQQYVVSYNGMAMWGNNATDSKEVTLTEDANNATEFTVTELVPFSSYKMCVAAWVGVIEGKVKCLDHLVETDEDLPSEPGQISIVNSSDTSISISWEEPVQHNGVLLDYEVTWSDDGGDGGSENISEIFYTIEDLTPCVEYTVTVVASTSIGQGPPTNISTSTVDEIPPAVGGVEASDVGARTLTLSWTEPVTLCNVTAYNITYEGTALWGDHRPDNDDATTNTTKFQLDSLTPSSNYTVCVAAETTAGWGATNCTEAQTEEDKPSEPQSLKLIPTQDSISVEWEEPDEQNGVLQNYNISWYDSEGVSGSDQVNSSVTSYLIEELSACLSIKVAVAASTTIGFGQESEEQTADTLPEVPPAVGGVEASDVGARNLTLSWTEPETFCEVTAYNITYEGTALWGDQRIDSGDAAANTTKLQLDSLTPSSIYTVCVAAETTAGWGETNCTETLTDEDAPSAPNNVQVSDVKAKKVSLKWEPPTDLNGVLTNYTATVYASDNDTVLHSVTFVDDTLSYLFSDLDPETEYSFEVQACTKAGCSSDYSSSTTAKSWVVLIVLVSVGVVVVGALVALAILKKNTLRKAFSSGTTNKNNSSSRKDAGGGRPKQPIRKTTFDRVEDAAVQKDRISECIQELKSVDGAALQAEFQQMEKKSVTGTMNIATSPANYQKNRYANILPFDDNIVYLKSRTDNYVNASLVQDYECNDLFIAAQGPMLTTVIQFWQLIWEQDVENIVMLAKCFENGKEKCAEYWPELKQTKVLTQSFKIVNCSEDHNESYVTRTLELRYKQNSRFVKQFHYTAWPDFGVPDDSASILDLMAAVKKSFINSASVDKDRHILVHCSAGVGRTGTFIGVWNLCHRELNEFSEDINIMKEVLDMREKRVTMVQTPEQYLMLYKCFEEFYKDPQRWPLPESEPQYLNPDEDANRNPAHGEPIYENTASPQEESMYENSIPRKQEPIYENRKPSQQTPFNRNTNPRHQEAIYQNSCPQNSSPSYENFTTPPQTINMGDIQPRLDSSFSYDKRSFEPDSGSRYPGYDNRGAKRTVHHN